MIQGEVHFGTLETYCQTTFRRNYGIALLLRFYENEWFSRKVPEPSLTLDVTVFENEK